MANKAKQAFCRIHLLVVSRKFRGQLQYKRRTLHMHEANTSGLGSRVNYTLVAPVLASNMVLFEENEYFILVRINSLDSLDDLHLHSRSRRNELFKIVKKKFTQMGHFLPRITAWQLCNLMQVGSSRALLFCCQWPSRDTKTPRSAELTFDPILRVG